jgi:hypothetical protein
MTACAAFSKESRMRFINANKLDRKSGGPKRRDLQFPSTLSHMFGLERESRYELQLAHAGKGSAKNIGDLTVGGTIDTGRAWDSQIGMIEGILCLHFQLHR